MTTEEKASELAQYYSEESDYKRTVGYDCAIAMAEWKDEQFKEREEGLRGTINALDARLQKANELGMYYFDKCNVQKQALIDRACEWLRNNINDYYVAGEFEQWFDEMFEDFRKTMEEKQ